MVLVFITEICYIAKKAIKEKTNIKSPKIRNSKKVSTSHLIIVLSSSVSYKSIKNGVIKATVTNNNISSILYSPLTFSCSVKLNHELDMSNGMVAKKLTTMNILKTTTILPTHTRKVPSSLRSVNNNKMNRETPRHIIEKITVSITNHTSTIISIIIIKLLLLKILNTICFSF